MQQKLVPENFAVRPNRSAIVRVESSLLIATYFACAQLYVTEFAGGPLIGVVGNYDAKTGAAINASVITGLSNPQGIAMSGNTLFVANAGNTVGNYDATTGTAINARFIRGLNMPVALAVSGDTLFVANAGHTVGKYDATTGVANPSFITGLPGLMGLAVKRAK